MESQNPTKQDDPCTKATWPVSYSKTTDIYNNPTVIRAYNVY